MPPKSRKQAPKLETTPTTEKSDHKPHLARRRNHHKKQEKLAASTSTSTESSSSRSAPMPRLSRKLYEQIKRVFKQAVTNLETLLNSEIHKPFSADLQSVLTLLQTKLHEKLSENLLTVEPYSTEASSSSHIQDFLFNEKTIEKLALKFKELTTENTSFSLFFTQMKKPYSQNPDSLSISFLTTQARLFLEEELIKNFLETEYPIYLISFYQEQACKTQENMSRQTAELKKATRALSHSRNDVRQLQRDKTNLLERVHELENQLQQLLSTPLISTGYYQSPAYFMPTQPVQPYLLNGEGYPNQYFQQPLLPHGYVQQSYYPPQPASFMQSQPHQPQLPAAAATSSTAAQVVVSTTVTTSSSTVQDSEPETSTTSTPTNTISTAQKSAFFPVVPRNHAATSSSTQHPPSTTSPR